MVIRFLIFFCFNLNFLFSIPSIETSVPTVNEVDVPLNVTITVTHKKDEKININSFELDGKAILVEMVKETDFSPYILSIFRFQLKEQPIGKYTLSAISVIINRTRYFSLPLIYEISTPRKKAEINRRARFVSNKKAVPVIKKENTLQTPLIFRLHSLIDGPVALFPGQRTKIIYRISYNRNIDLTRSDFTFIPEKLFKKIGDVQVIDRQEMDVTIQELIQEVEAIESGIVYLTPSVIEGYVYQLKNDEKIYDRVLQHAESLPLELKVLPFPENKQPFSFNQTIGNIKVEAILQNSPYLVLGDEITLTLIVSGVKNLSDYLLPSLECQPGFKGFFESKDHFPLTKTSNTNKEFVIVLRPLISGSITIPSFEFSSFDPASQSYVSVFTTPIPIFVSSVNSNKKTHVTDWKSAFSSENLIQPQLLSTQLTLRFIEFKKSPFNWIAFSLVLIIPFGLTSVILNQSLFIWFQKRRKMNAKRSQQLFKSALKETTPLLKLELLEESVWLWVWENNKLEWGDRHLEKLTNSSDQSLQFILYQIQSMHYGKEVHVDFSHLIEQISNIITTP